MDFFTSLTAFFFSNFIMAVVKHIPFFFITESTYTAGVGTIEHIFTTNSTSGMRVHGYIQHVITLLTFFQARTESVVGSCCNLQSSSCKNALILETTKLKAWQDDMISSSIVKDKLRCKIMKYGVLRKLQHIFPNTYQRIKSIRSPAKGGTGRYRFNYQPGS